MQVSFTKGKDRDFIEARRADGTTTRTTFPKKGLFPHDAVHLIVEKRLRFHHGFWGRLAGGATPEEIAAIAKAGGHASSVRAREFASPRLSDEEIGDIRRELGITLEAWRVLTVGESLTLHY